MPKVAGCAWIEGNDLHYIASDASEWKFLGTWIGTAQGAVPGSFWIDSNSNQMHYIDEYQNERYLPSEYEGGHELHSDGSYHADTLALPSVWVEGDLIRFIRSSALDLGEEDSAHSDSDYTDQHSDIHSDITHLDGHNDHTGSYGDEHDDVVHGDHYWDHHVDFDIEGEYRDKHGDDHSDSSHLDTHDDSYSHGDSHSDRNHSDTYGDNYTDADHGDQPVEVGA